MQDEISRLTQRAQAAGEFWDEAPQAQRSRTHAGMHSATDSEITCTSQATSRSYNTSNMALGNSVYGIPRGNYRTAGGNLTLAAGSGNAVMPSQLR